MRQHRRLTAAAAAAAAMIAQPGPQSIKVQINDRRRVQRQYLTEDEAADDGNSERPTKFAAVAEADGERQRTEQGRIGGHHDRPEAQEARLENRLRRGKAATALSFQRKVDHHDGIFLDEADEQDDADQTDDAEFGVTDHQRQHRANAGRWQRRKYRDRMDVALVEYPEHDVDRDQRRQDQIGLVPQ